MKIASNIETPKSYLNFIFKNYYHYIDGYESEMGKYRNVHINETNYYCIKNIL